jgi:hypothetical protein
MSIHHGRGSEAKGIHFFQTIQLPQLQSKDLVSMHTHFFLFSLFQYLWIKVEIHWFLKMLLQMIPRNFVERYWKNVSNPISLKLPNESVCKIFWVQLGDDVWLLDWKRFARSLRCGDLLVFRYKGGSDFHVIIFDDSKLEIDYSSMIFNDEQEANESEDDVIEITDESDDYQVKSEAESVEVKEPKNSSEFSFY